MRKLGSALGALAITAGVAALSLDCGGSTPQTTDSDASTGVDGSTTDPEVGSPGTCTLLASGAACATGAECCSNQCVGGTCNGMACVLADVACTHGFDCCSGTCAGSKCVGSARGDGGGGTTGGGACLSPAAACSASNACCSGLCEPVTGMAGVVQCLDACKGNGVACAKAQDCCSLGCNGGVCGPTKCTVEGDSCTGNVDCCSGICAADHKCAIDSANSTCRPTGETCNSGPQSGCCLATPTDDLCDKTVNPPRCGLPPAACRGTTATCAADADCCSGHCDPGTKKCSTPCVPTSGGCTTGADCCASSCTNGSCDAPQPPPTDSGTGTVCSPIGVSCVTSSQCCTGLCLGGFCDRPPA